MFLISSERMEICEPFAAAEIDHILGTGNESPGIRSELAKGLTPDRMEAIADMQRAIPFVSVDGEYDPLLAIGGQLMEHVITREGVKVRTVKDWIEQAA